MSIPGKARHEVFQVFDDYLFDGTTTVDAPKNQATSETYVSDGERIDDADERTVIERTDAENEAFRAKLNEWRRTRSIPGYTGPKAVQ